MATLLAKQHVNARNDTLLPVLNETLMRECPINFSMTFYNTYLTPSRTIKSVVDILTTTSPHMVGGYRTNCLKWSFSYMGLGVVS